MTGDEDVTVHVPEEAPTLDRCASRTLLEILVELTTIPVLDGPVEGVDRDC
jgi:hypothetical protein